MSNDRVIGSFLTHYFFYATLVKFAFQGADTVDKKSAVQMIDFVLEHDRQEPVGFEAKGLTISIHPFDNDPGGSFDIGSKIRDAQTSLVF
jgi:hypothetical protein